MKLTLYVAWGTIADCSFVCQIIGLSTIADLGGNLAFTDHVACYRASHLHWWRWQRESDAVKLEIGEEWGKGD